METNTLTKTDNRIESNNLKDLSIAYNEFILDLEESVENTKKYNGEPVYRFSTKTFAGNGLKTVDFTKVEIGIRDIKRLKRYLKQAMFTKSLNSINKLFHLVYKRILKEEKYPKLICDKHDKIQKLRTDWKKQQLIADQLLESYKKEKGDFYKEERKLQ